MHSKYILANIQIPIELLDDGTHVMHSECTNVHFTHCDNLPSKNKENQDIATIIQEYLDSQISVCLQNKWNETVITGDAIHKRKPHKNLTFKKKPSNRHNYTAKDGFNSKT